MTTLELLTGFLAAAAGVGTPLLLAATGEMISQRGGVINLGVEGAMLMGALAAAIGSAAGGPWAGVALAIGGGMFISGVFAAVSIGLKADQIITGAAVTLLSIGLTGVLFRRAFGEGGPGLTIPTFERVTVPGLVDIPLVGQALFGQTVLTYLALLLVPCAWWLLQRTWWGLSLRACGEGADAARAAGVRVGETRTIATMVGGALAGLAGATLVLAQVGTFTEKMTAGRGFIAIAIVILGRWQPFGVLAAAMFFGAATALQYLFQASGTALPYQWFLMLPYVLALGALAGAVGMGKARAPAELGKGS
ncbi:MAG: ABC transporter permease [Gemmatimonadales bacterium]